MKYAVIYRSRSGNTRLLAEEIYHALDVKEDDKAMVDLGETAEIPEADVYFIGFAVHNNLYSMKVLDCFEKIFHGKFALFATCGYLPTEKYKANLEKYLDAWLPEEAEYLGMFLCQGKVDAECKTKMLEKMPDKENELHYMFDHGDTHPDGKDLDDAAEFAIKIQESVN